ncbi:MAG TPA: MFS transporter, partial [Pseudonocardia sp.]|nr:MFS transporter [Pseudonocardia sp.]
NDEAEALVRGIEQRVERETGTQLPPVHGSLRVTQRTSTGFGELTRTVLWTYPRRTLLGLALLVGQAFLYNAVYFTFALVLATFFGVPSASSGLYLIPLALGSLVGPLVLGRLFDTVGRRTMISVSYLGSGVLLIGAGWLFSAGVLSAWTLAAAWAAVFFLASCGASAAYRTVSEIFPMEIRAMCIALFYAVGTGLGGIVGPVLFGALVETGRAGSVALGYYVGAVVMIIGGVAELALGVEAEQRPLEDAATPLSAQPIATGADEDRDPTRRPVPTRTYNPRPVDDPERDRELGAILQALGDGPLGPTELAERVDAAAWEPGRFTATLRYGLATGALLDDGRDDQVRARYHD